MRHTDNVRSFTLHLTRTREPLGGVATREQGAVDTRVVLYADDVRHRLHPVCLHWSDDEFEELVQHIARMKVRWTELDRAD